jgi:hypothetical protein
MSAAIGTAAPGIKNVSPESFSRFIFLEAFKVKNQLPFAHAGCSAASSVGKKP